MASVDGERWDEMRAAFEAADRDGDGLIDATEFEGFADQLALAADSRVARQAFGEIDRNGDGRISLDEFAHWWGGD
ncbi:EF-hand domain-containing protein [Alkalilimnicola sp. S0819]|uniref:EF-hand domain-containing protein n=1 Tax=Alkalilimnicola sp. S0819 TaxID=2613922 RepID=UPI001262A70F|nr:EF-hand domain-containing protein [Alkalilimnicola sp. S0819]KAB7619644.1 EF-hand domain-containing protein [Alkalilimnicola sp. S0819]MPQ17582.1 hypothetical protein [Alkalilimnicola sp. S0819]